MSFSRWAYAGVLAAGIVAGAVHITLGLYPLTFIAWLVTGVGVIVLAAESVPAAARVFQEDLALVRRLPGLGRSLEVQAVATTGQCARGYHEQDKWAVDAAGRLTPKLCWAAASALALTGNDSMDEQQVVCRCPLAGRNVSFAVRPVPAAA